MKKYTSLLFRIRDLPNKMITTDKSHSEREDKFWKEEYGLIYHYLEKSTPYQKLIEDTVEFLPVKAGDRILDLGCGSGALMRKIWRKTKGKVEEIVALDFAQVQLEVAEKKLQGVVPAEHKNRFKFVLHDLRKKLPFSDNYFDSIVAGLVIPYIYEHEGKKGREALLALLGEIKRVLKAGGYLIWSSPIKNVQFWKVFLASWKDILDIRDPKRLIMGPRILRYALQIQKKGNSKFYNFLDAHEIELIHKSVGFERIYFKRSFAGQAWVKLAQKPNK